MILAETINIPGNLPTTAYGVIVVIALAIIAIIPTSIAGFAAILQVRQSRQSKQNAEKLDKAQETLDEVSGQVTNGGTNLAATVGDINRKFGMFTEYADEKFAALEATIGNSDVADGGLVHKALISIGTDISALRGEVGDLRGEVGAERAARGALEDRFKRAFPEPGD